MTDFVTVLCKLPQGITIDCGVPGKDYAWVHVPGPLHGSAGRARVPTATWESWLACNKDLHIVKDGSVRLA